VSSDSVDDISGLTLSALTIASSTDSATGFFDLLNVESALSVASLTVGSGAYLAALANVDIGSITALTSEVLPTVAADGAATVVHDEAAVEPAVEYSVADGATIELAGSPNAGSELNFEQSIGTFALADPGATIATELVNAISGDVLELPGSVVNNVAFGSDDSITISTDKGSFDFANVYYDPGVPPVTGYTASFDATTGLEAITLTGASTEIAVDDTGTTADIENVDFLAATPDAIVNKGFLDGSLTIANNGTLNGTGTGLLNTGTITKGWDIQANKDVDGDTDGISNSGTVLGGWDLATNSLITGSSSGILNSGSLAGGWDIQANKAVDGGTDGASNTGTVTGGWDIQSNKAIDGGIDGISNSGTVIDGWDMQENKALVITNLTDALSDGSDGETITGGSFGILNTGIVTGGWDLAGIDLISGGTDGISNTGSISGGWSISDIGQITGGVDGISNTSNIGGGFTIDNDGTITGTAGDGILSTPANITNESGGIISGLSGIVLSDGGSVLNAGTIIGTGGTAISILHGPALVEIDPGAAFGGKVVDAAGTGTLDLDAGTTAGLLSGIGSSFTGFSNILVGSGAAWTFDGANTIAADQTLADDGTLTVSGIFTNDGIVTTDPATITYNSAVTGNGTIEIGVGSDVIFYGSVASTETVEFLSNTGTLTLADPTAFEAKIVGTGTEIVICYLRGTRIQTPKGQVNVETLKIGDTVVTHFGGVQPIKWIGRQSYARRFVKNNRDQLPVRIEAGALGEYLPARELYVSPGHSMLIEGTLVLAKSLVNGLTITQHYAPEEIHYYQIELEVHDCVLAEGAWSETYADSEGMRNKFHNALEFFTLYPDYRAPAEPQLCAPRPQSGAALDEALRSIVLRAATGEVPGALLGWIEDISEDGIRGWAQDKENLELPVLLEVLIGEQVVHTILACDRRDDLAEAGIGQGRCSFHRKLPAYIRPDKLGEVWIKRAADGAALPYSQELQARVGLRYCVPRADQRHPLRAGLSFRGRSQSW